MQVAGAAAQTLRQVTVPGEVSLTLSGGGTIDVTLPEGVAVSARLVRPDGAIQWWGSMFGPPWPERQLEPPGRELTSIAPGSYQLVLTTQAGESRTFPVAVVEGQTSEVAWD